MVPATSSATSDLLDFEGDLYYLHRSGLSLNLRLDGSWLRCVDCGRIHPEALADAVPGCLGGLVEADADYLTPAPGSTESRFCAPSTERHLEPFGCPPPSTRRS